MKKLAVAMCLLAVSFLTGCGSSPTAPTPVPAASITATGNGILVLHPSIDSAFVFALVCPIRIRETGGGKAAWEYARFSIFNAGVEIERGEIGGNIISTNGFTNIAAFQDKSYELTFRFNSNPGTFDRIDITLGFADTKDTRRFTVLVPFDSFTGEAIDLTPKSVPVPGAIRLR